MSFTVITNKRRNKMSEASHTTGQIAKITQIAIGTGGVDQNGNVIEPLGSNTGLNKEILRRPYTKTAKTSDTSYEYALTLSDTELIGQYISEMALIDADGDVVAITNFLSRGKDDTEETYTMEDSY